MKKFIITIEEMFANEFEVLAENSVEALDIAEQRYREGEFVVNRCQPRFKQIASAGDEPTEWMEF